MNEKYVEAVWDATPIIKIFCAELHGHCACMSNILEHVYPEKVKDELHRRNFESIYEQHIDRHGNRINDKEYAIAILNAIKGSMTFYVRPNPDIEINTIETEFNLDTEDGEFWVVAYAINRSHDNANVLVIMDDGPALNLIYNEQMGLKRFKIWTTLHVIHYMIESEKILTSKMGSELFLKLYKGFSKNLSNDAKDELGIELLFNKINDKAFIKEHRIGEVKRPFYVSDGSKRGWYRQ